MSKFQTTKTKTKDAQSDQYLQNTIESQNNEISELKDRLSIWANTICEQESIIKGFEAIWYRFKNKLETQSYVDKIFRQINMNTLHLWKDFESLIKELTKDMLVSENDTYANLKIQLNNLLKITDIRIPEDIHNENQLLISEYEQLLKSSSLNKEQAYLSSHRNSINLSKISVNDTSNIISWTNWVDKTTGSASPIRGCKYNWIESSFNLSNTNNAEFEILRKDVLRLTEENRDLKRRISADSSTSHNKWKLCKRYHEIIDSLLIKQANLEQEYKEKLSNAQSMYETICTELKDLEVKHEFQSKLLNTKSDNEESLKQEVSQLQGRNENLINHLKHGLDSSKGFELLEGTISNLLLVLINKNECDLSQKQKQLIKDLFSSSQIKVINTFKEKITGLENEKKNSIIMWRKQTDISKRLIILSKRYISAIKDCIKWYTTINVPISKLFLNDQVDYLNNHSTKILNEFSKDIQQDIFQLSEFSVEVSNDLLDLIRQSNELGLEKYEELALNSANEVNFNISSTERKTLETKLSKNITVSNIDILPETVKKSSANDYILTDIDINFKNQDSYSPTPRSQTSSGSKTPRKSKWKRLKKKKNREYTKQDVDNERFIRESLEELQREIDEEEKFYKAEQPKQTILNTWDNNTISEVDEKYEEETVFDKDGRKIFSRSLKSSRWHNDQQTKILFQDLASSSERWDKILDHWYQIPNIQNMSVESESVRFEEDLLNDTLKLDDPMF